MPKSLRIVPEQMRAKGVVKFSPIPLNQYDRSLAAELSAGTYTPADLCRVERDMKMIRAFETMLDTVKKQGGYQGLAYNHRGPAHLSMGQEAAAVGQAFYLDADDHIFGSHRSHGEVLAKGLSAIARLSDADLQRSMAQHWDGATLRVVEQGFSGTVKELATDFLVYGMLAEIFGRRAGFNMGFGGSMHAFFTPWGIYPNNAIVGGSADIAVGAALFKRVNQRPGIVIANIGDAAAGCGPV
jgi:2-oxoisovalerate dehydrogenase E1 component